MPTRTLLLSLLVVILALPAQAQKRDGTLPRTSPNAAVSFTAGVTEITVSYGAPSVRGRTVFGDLEPYGEVWRAGANEATTVTFSTDVEVEDEPLEAGTYGLFAIPGEDEWTFIFNRVADQWGAYNYDEAEDALRVTVEAEEAPFRETMAFYFDDYEAEDGEHEVDVVLHWAETRAAFEVDADTEALIAERAAAAAASPTDWQAPYRYAAYALENDMDAAAALAWAEASVQAEPRYENLALKARLHAALGEYAAAVEAGERAASQARSMAERPRGFDRLEADLQSWRQEG